MVINWDVFTMEEKVKINKLMQSGGYADLTCIIENMDRKKEIELQKIIDGLKPQASEFVSVVRDEYFKANPNGPQTPQEEAELQKRLEDEFLEYKIKMQEKSDERLQSLKRDEDTVNDMEKKVEKDVKENDSNLLNDILKNSNE